MAKAIVSGNEADHTQEIAQLKAIIRRMDQAAQQVLGHIGDVASLALLALESPRGQKDVTAIASALDLIHERALDAWFEITDEAKKVDCAYFNDRVFEQCQARSAAKEVAHG